MDAPLLRGLIAATVTPFDERGELDLRRVPPIVDHLVASGVTGLYVCGSTGEGVSLTQQERKDVAAAYVEAAAGRLPVVIQVGQNSLRAAADLAAHAQQVGADAVSATCPSYFPIRSLETLIDSMREIAAAAPDVPFYYYHIPGLTNVELDMVQFLRTAAELMPNLRGLKFTAPLAHQFQECLELDQGRFEVLWGYDEMLLSALAVGGYGAVGSTYNIAAPVYQRVIDAFHRGDLAAARLWQSRAVAFIRVLTSLPFHAALRETLALLGLPCGPSRLPNRSLDDEQREQLRRRLEALGFFDWIRADAAATGDGAPRRESKVPAPKGAVFRHESV